MILLRISRLRHPIRKMIIFPCEEDAVHHTMNKPRPHVVGGAFHAECFSCKREDRIAIMLETYENGYFWCHACEKKMVPPERACIFCGKESNQHIIVVLMKGLSAHKMVCSKACHMKLRAILAGK